MSPCNLKYLEQFLNWTPKRHLQGDRDEPGPRGGRDRDAQRRLRRLEEIYHRILARRDRPAATTGTQVVQAPPQVVFTGAGQQQVVSAGGADDKTKKQVPGVQVRQTVKQIQTVGARHRDKRVKRSTKQALTAKRKEYNQAKAASKKVITAQKKAFYQSANEKIKKMPVARRKAARKQDRQQMK